MGTLTYADPGSYSKASVRIEIWQPISWLPVWRAQLVMRSGRKRQLMQTQYLTAFSETSIRRAADAVANDWLR